MFQPPHQLARGLALRSGVDVDAAAGDLAVDEDVLGDRHVREQVQFLEHDADAVAAGIVGAVEMDRLAVHQNLPLGQLLDARDNLHHRGLARAVFAHQHVDRAHAQVEIHPFQCAGAGIDLGAAPDLQADGVRHGAISSRVGITRIGSVAVRRVVAPSKRTVLPVRSPSGSRIAPCARSFSARASFANSIWSR